MTIKEAIQANPAADDAAIVILVNASGFKPVASNAVLEWLGAGARKAKIDGFIASRADATDPQVVGLRAALEVLLLASSNPTAYLSLEPGSDQRALLAAAVTVGVISTEDATALLSKAKTTPDISESDVAAERVAIALDDAKNVALANLETYASQQRAAINAATTLSEIPIL